MVAACDLDRALRQRAVALTPTSSEFVTCMATPGALEGMRKHVRLEAYPMLAVVLVRETSGGRLTAAEFAQVSDLVKKRSNSIVADQRASQAQLDKQDAAIAANGGTLRRKSEGHEFGGFFEFTKALPSFTYLTTRRTTETEAGATEKVCEVVAASSMWAHGRMFGVIAIDHCVGSPPYERVKSLTKTWLSTFESINPPGK